jgi:hypothetical protein
MRGWILGQVVLLVGILGQTGAAGAQNLDSGAFASEAQAQAYLRQNPTGPLAKAAFLAIVEFQLARENPGFSRADIAAGVNLTVRAAGQSTPRGSSDDDGRPSDLY